MEKEQANKTTAAVTVTDDYAVVVADKEGLQSFFKDGANLESLYGAIEKKALGLVADVATKEGISQIKSAARQLASVKTKVDDIGKKVVAELKELPNVIDANRKSFREKMEALQEEIRRPVTEIENREKEIDGIKAMHMAVAMSGSAIIRQQLEKVKAIELTEEKWKESLAKAEKAVAGEVSALNLMLQEAEKARQDAERKAKETELAARNATNPVQAAAVGAQQAVTPMSKGLPTPKPSKWTPEMKAVNKSILETFTATIEEEVQKVIAGFTPSGYRVAAENAAKALVSAIIKGNINNLKVEY